MTHPPRATLSQRLRELREDEWQDARITQRMLAKLIQRSEATISSWENPNNPLLPQQDQLELYAHLFSTRRSVHERQLRLIPLGELTEAEEKRRSTLLNELLTLYNATTADQTARSGNLWEFNDEFDVTIVCGQLSEHLRENFPYTNPDDPDYVDAYRWADLDSLIEIYGHLRALNPSTSITRRLSDEMEDDDYTSHLVVLGGPDFNEITRDLMTQIGMPVALKGDWSKTQKPHFEADGRTHHPEFDGSEPPKLRSDVALFYRGPNPYNLNRTLTLCYGMYGNGTFGAIRAFTDIRFRDRNSAYVRSRVEAGGFGVLTRVTIRRGRALTPDLTRDSTQLFEWTADPSTGETP